MYKAFNNMSPAILNDIFASRDTPCNLRNPTSFKIQKVYSVYNGTVTLSHLELKIWSLVPQEIRLSVALGSFKSKIKSLSLQTMQKIFTSSRIYLKRLIFIRVTAVSLLSLIFITFSIYFSEYFDFI